MNLAVLQEVLESIYNWFDVNRVRDEFTVHDGTISVPDIQDGQFFRVVGSVFNDGLYRHPAHDLTDEVFTGEVWIMAVPNEIIDIAEEVERWNAKYGDAVNSPYQSESFGGYSYTKSQASYNGTSVPMDWRSVFKTRLNRWRKMPCS